MRSLAGKGRKGMGNLKSYFHDLEITAGRDPRGEMALESLAEHDGIHSH